LPKYKVSLKLCTLLKGVPNGPAYIECTIPGDKFNSFKGVGVFDQGRLHMGPFTAILGTGEVFSFS
jgi:hypothetical protein